MELVEKFTHEAEAVTTRYKENPLDKNVHKAIITLIRQLNDLFSKSSLGSHFDRKFYTCVGTLVDIRLGFPEYDGKLEFAPACHLDTFSTLLCMNSESLQGLVYMLGSFSRSCPDFHKPFHEHQIMLNLYDSLNKELSNLCKLEVLQVLGYLWNSPATKGMPLNPKITPEDVIRTAKDCCSWKVDDGIKCLYMPKNVGEDVSLYVANMTISGLISKDVYYDHVTTCVKELNHMLGQSKHWYTKYSIVSSLNSTLDEPVIRRDKSQLRTRITSIDFKALGECISKDSVNVILLSIIAQLLYEIINRWESFGLKSLDLDKQFFNLDNDFCSFFLQLLNRPPTENESVYSAACISMFLNDPLKRTSLTEAGVIVSLIDQIKGEQSEKLDEKQYQKLLYVCRGLMVYASEGMEMQLVLQKSGIIPPILSLIQHDLPVALDLALTCLLTNLTGNHEVAKTECLDNLAFDKLLCLAGEKVKHGCEAGPYLMCISNLVDVGRGRVRPSLVGDLQANMSILLPVFESFFLSVQARDPKALEVSFGLLRLCLRGASAEDLSKVSSKMRKCLTAFSSHPWAKDILDFIQHNEVSPTTNVAAVKSRCALPDCSSTAKELRKCSRCKSVEYCSKDCQRKHWSLHKKVCKPQ